MPPRSYPRPPPPTWPHVHPRSLLPIYPPPQQPSLPPLPSPPREPAFDAPYSLSTHLFPAAFLRTTRDVPVPAPPPPSAGKEERKAILLKTGQELRSMRRSSVTQGHPKVLWNCANRYVRVGLDPSKRGITLLFAHANGFPKEVIALRSYQPTPLHWYNVDMGASPRRAILILCPSSRRGLVLGGCPTRRRRSRQRQRSFRHL